MQLGKALVGALIGGAVGIAMLVLVHSFVGDRYWLAIPVALLTGLGVRWMVSTKGHPSYARGALTAVVAMLAFFAWYPIMAQLTSRRSIAQPVVLERSQQAEEDADADEAAGEAAPAEPVRMEERSPMSDVSARNARPQEISALDIISLCVAAFIAYELGRGSGASKAPAETARRDEEAPPLATGQTAMPPD